MIIQEQIEEIVERIVKNVKVKQIILFGSYAYGQPTSSSDIDLLIIKQSSNKPRYKRGSEIRKHLRGMKLAIDLLVYTEEEIEKWRDVKTSFIANIITKGKILYGT